MTLEEKILRVEELARQRRKIDAELLALLGGETRRGRPPAKSEPATTTETPGQ